MKFISVRIITADIKRLVSFYESVFATAAIWANDDFAEIKSDIATLAIGSTRTLAFFGGQIAAPESNKSVILEFLVKNVDADYERIREHLPDVVQKPTTMPWGNRSLLLRDPDGSLVNLFTPVSDDAQKKFGS